MCANMRHIKRICERNTKLTVLDPTTNISRAQTETTELQLNSYILGKNALFSNRITLYEYSISYE